MPLCVRVPSRTSSHRKRRWRTRARALSHYLTHLSAPFAVLSLVHFPCSVPYIMIDKQVPCNGTPIIDLSTACNRLKSSRESLVANSVFFCGWPNTPTRIVRPPTFTPNDDLGIPKPGFRHRKNYDGHTCKKAQLGRSCATWREDLQSAHFVLIRHDENAISDSSSLSIGSTFEHSRICTMEWHLGLPLLRAYKDCIEAARPDRTERATQGDRRSRCEAKVFEKPAEKRVQWSAWYLTAILATQASLLLAAGWHVYHQRGRSRGAGALEEKRTSPRKYDSGELVEQDVQKDSTDYLATAGNEYPIRSPLTQADGIAAGSCRNLNLQTELDVLCITIPALTHCYGSSTPSSSASESLSWHSCFSVADAEQIEGDTPSNKSVDERIDEVLKLSPKVDS